MPPEVSLLASHTNWETRILSSLLTTCQRDGFGFLRKAVLGLQNWQKAFLKIASQRRRERNSNFMSNISKVNGLREERLVPRILPKVIQAAGKVQAILVNG